MAQLSLVALRQQAQKLFPGRLRSALLADLHLLSTHSSMETVAAIGIAGNIVQFIDFGCKLLSKAKAIYRDGAAVEHTDLRKVTEDLTALITKLSEDIRQASASNEPELQELCEGCLGVAKELQHALTKVNASSGQGRWKSIRAALKAVWGKEHITELKGRLDAYSMQLDRRVLVGLR